MKLFIAIIVLCFIFGAGNFLHAVNVVLIQPITSGMVAR